MNPMILLPHRLVLASGSPRRSQLLREAGFAFDVMVSDADESFPSDMPAAQVPVFLARNKAMATLPLVDRGTLVLAADTVVILDGVIFNKPETKEEARFMLRQMSGRTHQVITGVCIMTHERSEELADESLVVFEPLTDEEIEYYIQTCRPYDKAGSYGIQEWIGHCKIRRIEGSYANVMGLPIHRVYRALQEGSW